MKMINILMILIIIITKQDSLVLHGLFSLELSNGAIVAVLNEPVSNLGAVFDQNISMSAHVSKVFKLPP